MKIEQETKANYLNSLIIYLILIIASASVLLYIAYAVVFLKIEHRLLTVLLNVFICAYSINSFKENYQKIIKF